MLTDVKNILGITKTSQNAILAIYIVKVVVFLNDANVPSDKITSGIVARGISDLQNYGG